MSRHRNMHGWIAEAQGEYDEDSGDEGRGYAGTEDMLPIDSPVKACYYGDGGVYPGWVVDH
eukprot:CAMPEP_0173433106 /NCGR_PEP_ID=MMETSP1357-20121228/10677_1 /TAXON_ID=77926 /ORGANISM="Hemiselmis rufescens, Strain PCC563" /LENGTH=60 /DNA_ID=CAMNT_0014397785 /DNA_START=26 /DNA_END=205 /DNA_ORIENTATION=+